MLIMFSCYRLIFLPSVVITLITSGFLYQSSTPLYLVQAFWTKLVTTGLLLLFIKLFRSNHFYFFNNLGQTNGLIYLNLIIPDILISVALFSLVLYI